MAKQPVILIYDVGKTNKKILLYDPQYRLLFEESVQLPEITDEDGFPCEDIHALTEWIKISFQKMQADERFSIEAVNFSAYGAGVVCVDENLCPLLPLYNYLKPYPEELKNRFYGQYGGEAEFSKITASPVLGNLNSGMQLYRLKYEKPEVFSKIKYALHLPQYLSSILTGKAWSEITGIGCHTNLWDFTGQGYHDWVLREGIAEKLPVLNRGEVARLKYKDKSVSIGVGLHDSSSALIPYLAEFHEPFLLLSTGTWCISLHAFNQTPLSSYELQNDCLCYLTWQGQPVKAARLFIGFEHEQKVKQIAHYYKKPVEEVTGTACNQALITQMKNDLSAEKPEAKNSNASHSNASLLNNSVQFNSCEEAYHQLMIDLVEQQVRSTRLVWGKQDKIFVDGGFSKNTIYMNLMAEAFSEVEVYSAMVPQSSALGAAIAIHKSWSESPLPANLIQLKLYPPPSKQGI